MSTPTTKPTLTPTPTTSWYRERWVWLLMLPPLASVCGGVTMAYLATSEPVALVVEDYARIEDITEQRFARDAHAAALELTAELTFELDAAGRSTIAVTLDSPREGLPASLLLELRHATRADADQVLTLLHTGTRYAGEAELAAGRYRVELLAPDRSWRLGGSLTRVPGSLRLAAQADGGR